MIRLLFALLVLSPTLAFADGAAVLKAADEALNRSDDMYFEYEVVNQEKGTDPKAMELRVWVKDSLRMTEFVAPGDMKGTKALVLKQDQMYIYLPAYKKVRRVSSSLTQGGFLGTTFANEDISTTIYSPYFDAKQLSETEAGTVLELTPKEGTKVGYLKLEMTVDKKTSLPIEIKYFNKKGAHTKTETRSDISCEGDICNAADITMVDHSRNDASTSLLRRAWEVNQGLDDSLFTVRSLQ